MKKLIDDIKKIEHGFKHILEAGDIILADKTQKHFDLATKFLSDDTYQVRMLATYLLGQLSTDNSKALKLLETKVADDKDWRVQEMLAKAFDHYCKTTDNGLIRIIRKDNSIFQIPYGKDTIYKADKGEYRLRATKEVVIDPDFLMTWEISTNGNDDLEEMKMYGYIPPNE